MAKEVHQRNYYLNTFRNGPRSQWEFLTVLMWIVCFLTESKMITYEEMRFFENLIQTEQAALMKKANVEPALSMMCAPEFSAIQVLHYPAWTDLEKLSEEERALGIQLNNNCQCPRFYPKVLFPYALDNVGMSPNKVSFNVWTGDMFPFFMANHLDKKDRARDEAIQKEIGENSTRLGTSPIGACMWTGAKICLQAVLSHQNGNKAGLVMATGEGHKFLKVCHNTDDFISTKSAEN